MSEVWFDRTLIASKEMTPVITVVEKEYIGMYGLNSYRQNKQTVECFVVNLIYARSLNERVYISRDRNTYKSVVVDGKTVDTGIGYVSVMKVINLFEALGWINSIKGFKDLETKSKRDGMIIITESFIHLIDSVIDLYAIGTRPVTSVMVLTKKDKEGKSQSLEYTMTQEKRVMRNMVQYYNEYMSKQVVLDKTGKRLSTSLNRIFNRGDEQFMNGGRFYATGSSYQLIPEVDRVKMTINGESVNELDFKTIHIAMWCAMKGVIFSEGYDIYSQFNNNHYELNPSEINEIVNNYKPDYNPIRNLQKLIWLVMINCGKEGNKRETNKTEAIAAIQKNWLEDNNDKTPVYQRRYYGIESFDIVAVMDFIEESFPFLEDLLYSDMGIKLMRKDSDVMQNILTECVGLDIPVLCVHDSVVVPQSKVGKVMEIMKASYKKVVGSENNCVITVK